MPDKNRDFDQLKPGVRIAFDLGYRYGTDPYTVIECTTNTFDASVPSIRLQPDKVNRETRRVSPSTWKHFGGYILPDTE